MYVASLTLRNFRSYDRAQIDLPAGVTVVQGPVAAGKTNLLEALYAGCVGRSFRTSREGDLIRRGESVARVTIVVGPERHVLELGIERGQQKLFRVDGARVERMADAESRPLVCVFAPDRLELVKGPAGVRRAHLDEVVAALWPAARAARRFYARALAQRNSLLSSVRSGRSGAESLTGWNREVARHGIDLMRRRAETVDLLGPRFKAQAAALGLPDPGELSYRPRSKALTPEELERELEEHLAADMERGFTTHGPHRDELRLAAAGDELRRFGSQGQQRLGLLSLLLAEWELLRDERGRPPVLLLDDVLSELDPDRRVDLLRLVEAGGQTLITTADPGAAGLAASAAARLDVAPGGELSMQRAA
jgi:DNA replication and repair protein RecF